MQTLTKSKTRGAGSHVLSLPRDPDGSIHLVARAWAVRGTR
jgi:hypothetical protein